ncbi:MAG: tyrosine-type recombinase/integrase [Nocardioidaceae bacterium]
MTTAKAYRLLRAILNTAVDDGRLKRNPCRVKGADQEKSPERPVATVGQVYAVADAMPARYRAFVLAAAFTSLRRGELIGLTRSDVDLDRGTLRVRRSLVQLNSGQLVSGPTKSTSGVRTVSIPAVLLHDLQEHLDSFVGSEAGALLFTTPAGSELRRNNWRRDVHWRKKLTDAGLPEGFHFHDLRHTGNHLASMSGASTRELMHRMGHGTVRAALIYQHATSERDRQIADAVKCIRRGAAKVRRPAGQRSGRRCLVARFWHEPRDRVVTGMIDTAVTWVERTVLEPATPCLQMSSGWPVDGRSRRIEVPLRPASDRD